MNQNVSKIFTKNAMTLYFEQIQIRISYKRVMWYTAQTGIDKAVLSSFFFSKNVIRHLCEMGNKQSFKGFSSKS